MKRIAVIGFNTFREAVRDRVLYNLVFFALLLVASALLFGQISIGIERIVLINLGLTAISIFGLVIAVFVGIGLVWKEIDKRTLYTILSRPVRRWEFVIGKFCGLIGTLVVNTSLMTVGFFATLLYLTHRLQPGDGWLLVAIYFIVLQFVIMIALALLFSSFSSPLLSSILALGAFIIGTFAEDLRGFSAMTSGVMRYVMTAVAYVVPNFASLNVISRVAHNQPLSGGLVLYNTLYTALYAAAAIAGAVLIFERRDLR